LTRKTSAYDIDGNSIGSELCGGECSDIIVDRNSGPVLRKDALRERLDLAERNGAKTARSLQAQVKAAYTCEEAEDAQGHTARPSKGSP
jgi:hypothetical protein